MTSASVLYKIEITFKAPSNASRTYYVSSTSKPTAPGAGHWGNYYTDYDIVASGNPPKPLLIMIDPIHVNGSHIATLKATEIKF